MFWCGRFFVRYVCVWIFVDKILLLEVKVGRIGFWFGLSFKRLCDVCLFFVYLFVFSLFEI